MDDATLVATARSEPERGFAAIYQRYGDRIHDYCQAVLRHRDDAADATQDTFLIAYERLGQLRDPGRLKPWLYAIARSRCLRRIRDRGRQRPTDDLEPLGPAAPPATGEVEATELRQLVWDAAAGLSDDDRAVLDLHLRHGLSGADLASALGVPAEKANLMLHRMKQRMGRSVGALLVARTGRADCPDLAALTTGQLTPLVRKRLARHVERCQTCGERRDRLTPELLYASVPLVPAPALLGEQILQRTSAGATASEAGPAVSDQLRWRDDGFPRPEPVHEPMPVPRRLAVGAGVAALAVLGLLGGGVVGRTIADSEPPPAAPAAAESAAPGSTPTAASPPVVPGPAPAAPGPAPAPPPRTPSPPVPAPSPTPSAGGPVDTAAPWLSPLRVGNCGATLTAEVDVLDDLDPDPTGYLILTWDAGPGSPVPMTHAGGGTYRAVVERKGDALGFVRFTAAGFVTDGAGNEAFRAVQTACTPVVD